MQCIISRKPDIFLWTDLATNWMLLVLCQICIFLGRWKTGFCCIQIKSYCSIHIFMFHITFQPCAAGNSSYGEPITVWGDINALHLPLVTLKVGWKEENFSRLSQSLRTPDRAIFSFTYTAKPQLDVHCMCVKAQNPRLLAQRFSSDRVRTKLSTVETCCNVHSADGNPVLVNVQLHRGSRNFISRFAKIQPLASLWPL